MGRSFWLAVAAYLLPTFPLGYAWHLVVFAEQYERLGLYREEVIVPFGLTSMLMQALIFAWMYPRLFSRRYDQWRSNAVVFGGVFGALAWSFTTLPVAAKYQMSSLTDFIMLETAFTFVQFLLVAPLIALSYRAAAGPAARTSPSRVESDFARSPLT